MLVRLERSEDSLLLVDVDGKVVASSEANRLTGYQRHVGAVCAVAKRGFGYWHRRRYHTRPNRGGLQKKGLKVLTLTVLQVASVLFASTRNFFVQCDWTLKKLFKEGRRIDGTIMTKWLE